MMRNIHISRAAVFGLALSLAAPISAQEAAEAPAQETSTESERFPVFGESSEREEFFARQIEERDQAWQESRTARAASETGELDVVGGNRPDEDGTPGEFQADTQVDPYKESYVGVYNHYAGVKPACVVVPQRPNKDDGPGFATPGGNLKTVCGVQVYSPPAVPSLNSPVRQRQLKSRSAYSRPGFDLNYPRN